MKKANGKQISVVYMGQDLAIIADNGQQLDLIDFVTKRAEKPKRELK